MSLDLCRKKFLLDRMILQEKRSRGKTEGVCPPCARFRVNRCNAAPEAGSTWLCVQHEEDGANDCIHLPQPGIDCSNPTSQGAVWLNESWQPSTGTGLGKGFGTCDFGGPSQPPVSVIELAKRWTLLRVGESVYITASSNSLHYETSKPGIYTFSATYLPPMLSNENRLRLKGVGIVVPEQKAFSESIQYRK
jgi:hypothetical protein